MGRPSPIVNAGCRYSCPGGFVTLPGKAAVRLMTKSVAVQHAKDNIRADSVHPGIMPPMRTSGRTADPALRAERMRVIPMRRPGEVDEVAYAISTERSSRRHEGG